MNYLKIRNWDKWQSYRADRGQPPWIKLHRELLRNPEWVGLTDAQKGQLVSIWMLAADRGGQLPADPVVIRKLCQLDENPDLQVFVSLGFIEPDANVTPDRRQHDQPEAETETETETEKKQISRPNGLAIELADFADFYAAYPRKVKRKEAEKVWLRLKPDQALLNKILQDVGWRVGNDEQWQDPRYIPHPSTYLNGERWTDQHDTAWWEDEDNGQERDRQVLPTNGVCIREGVEVELHAERHGTLVGGVQAVHRDGSLPGGERVDQDPGAATQHGQHSPHSSGQAGGRCDTADHGAGTRQFSVVTPTRGASQGGGAIHQTGKGVTQWQF